MKPALKFWGALVLVFGALTAARPAVPRVLLKTPYPKPAHTPSTYLPSTHVAVDNTLLASEDNSPAASSEEFPMVCGMCSGAGGKEERYRLGTCFGYVHHLHRQLAGYLSAMIAGYNAISNLAAGSMGEVPLNLMMVKVEEPDVNGEQTINFGENLPSNSAEPLKLFEKSFEGLFAELHKQHPKMADPKTLTGDPQLADFAALAAFLADPEKPFAQEAGEYAATRIQAEIDHMSALELPSEPVTVLGHLFESGGCPAVTRAFLLNIKGIASPVGIVVRLTPKRIAEDRSVVSVQTAMVISKDEAPLGSVKFAEGKVWPLAQVKKEMAGAAKVADLLQKLKDEGSALIVELPTGAFFDRGGDSEKHVSCKQGRAVLELAFRLLIGLEMTKDLPVGEAICQQIKLPFQLDHRRVSMDYVEYVLGWKASASVAPPAHKLAERILMEIDNNRQHKAERPGDVTVDRSNVKPEAINQEKLKDASKEDKDIADTNPGVAQTTDDPKKRPTQTGAGPGEDGYSDTKEEAKGPGTTDQNPEVDAKKSDQTDGLRVNSPLATPTNQNGNSIDPDLGNEKPDVETIPSKEEEEDDQYGVGGSGDKGPKAKAAEKEETEPKLDLSDLDAKVHGDILGDGNNLLSVETFLAFLRYPVNRFDWKELEQVHYLLYSRYAEFRFEHEIKDSKCPGDGRARQLVVRARGQPVLSLDIHVHHPKALISLVGGKDVQKVAIEAFGTLSDITDTSYFCLEVQGVLGMSFLSRLFCYPHLFKPESDRKVVNFSRVFVKVLKMFFVNYGAVLEELAVFLRTRIEVEDVRLFLYQLQLAKKEKDLELKPAGPSVELSKAVMGLRGQVGSSSAVEALRKTPDYLIVETDNRAIRDKVLLKFGVPGMLGGKDTDNPMNHWFAVNLEARPAADATMLVRLSAATKLLDLQFGAFWGSVKHHSFFEIKDEQMAQLRIAAAASFEHESHFKLISDLKLGYLAQSMGASLASWLTEVYSPSPEGIEAAKVTQALLPTSFKSFEASAVSNLATAAGLLTSLVMAMKLYDENLFPDIAALQLPAQPPTPATGASLYETEWLKVQAAFTSNSRDDTILLREGQELESHKMTDTAKIAPLLKQETRETLIKNMVTVLAAAETSGQLSEVIFLLTPSPEAQTSRKMRVRMWTYVQAAMPWLHLAFESMYFDLEYLFPLESQALTFVNLAQAVGDVIGHEEQREQLLADATVFKKFTFAELDGHIRKVLPGLAPDSNVFCWRHSQVGDGLQRATFALVGALPSAAKQTSNDQNVFQGQSEDRLKVADVTQRRLFESRKLFGRAESDAGLGTPPNRRLADMAECPDDLKITDQVTVVFSQTKSPKSGYLLEFHSPKGEHRGQNKVPVFSSFAFGTQYEYNYLDVVTSNLEKGLAGLNKANQGGLTPQIKRLTDGPKMPAKGSATEPITAPTNDPKMPAKGSATEPITAPTNDPMQPELTQTSEQLLDIQEQNDRKKTTMGDANLQPPLNAESNEQGAMQVSARKLIHGLGLRGVELASLGISGEHLSGILEVGTPTMISKMRDKAAHAGEE